MAHKGVSAGWQYDLAHFGLNALDRLLQGRRLDVLVNVLPGPHHIGHLPLVDGVSVLLDHNRESFPIDGLAI